MVGLDVIRGAAGVVATLKQRTWHHEHAEGWTGALEVQSARDVVLFVLVSTIMAMSTKKYLVGLH